MIWKPLEEMYKKAKAELLDFNHNGLAGSFCFTPEELRKENENGYFCWGPVNWKLEPTKQVWKHQQQKLF